MTTAEHTEGPWTYDRTTDRIGTAKGTVCIIDRPKDRSGRGLTKDEQDANARLIDAEPVPRKAVENLVGQLDRDNAASPGARMYAEEARVAIAKARGE